MNKDNNRISFHIDRQDFFTIPNILTYFRFLCVPAFLILYLIGLYQDILALRWAGVGVIFLASFTDLLDGKIARKFHQITELGKVIDPIADKVMQFAICIVVCLVYQNITGHYWLFFLAGVFLVKEISQGLLIVLLFRHGQYLNGAKWYGKVSTFVYDVLMMVILVLPLFLTEKSQWENGWLLAINIMIFVVLGLLIFAFIMYAIECHRQWKKNEFTIPDSLYPLWVSHFGSEEQKKAYKEKNESKEEKNN